VPVEKKDIGKLRVCIDFHNLNRTTSNVEYPMPVANVLINNALIKSLVFLMVMLDIIKLLWLKKMLLKWPYMSILYWFIRVDCYDIWFKEC
jgi:hypothetical protein